jgi:hypothetical protein
MADGNSPEGFHYGPAWAAGTQCCGKPQGCTNMSDQCVLKNHPWKRWHRETFGPAAQADGSRDEPDEEAQAG